MNIAPQYHQFLQCHLVECHGWKTHRACTWTTAAYVREAMLRYYGVVRQMTCEAAGNVIGRMIKGVG